MRIAALLLPLLTLAGCASAPAEPPRLTEKQAEKLARELDGRVPGEKVACITRFGGSDMTVISDQVLLYRVSSRLIYKNELSGRCSGLSRGDTLITHSSTGQLCRGDIARVAHLPSGMTTGSCALGDFIPYRKP